MVKKIFKIIILFILVFAFVLFLLGHSKKQDKTSIFTIGISRITDKYIENDNFYFTVHLDGYIVENLKLDSTSFSFKTSENIYNYINVDENCIGMTLKVIIPYDSLNENIGFYDDEVVDIGYILNNDYSSFCEIISITTEDNNIIQSKETK